MTTGTGEDATGGAVSESVRRALETELERAVLQAKSRSGAKTWGTLPGSIRSRVRRFRWNRACFFDCDRRSERYSRRGLACGELALGCRPPWPSTLIGAFACLDYALKDSVQPRPVTRDYR